MNTPFVVAFAVLGLVLAVLIMANVVSAAVIASYRRIGVLKSIGFTPAQVTATYLAQISIPAVAGAVAGTVLGNCWVLPVIEAIPGPAADACSSRCGSIWPSPLGMLALAGLAAAVPAVRAGRLSGGRPRCRRAGAPGRARRGGVPAGRTARAAGAGDDRAGRPVLPPGPIRGHAGRPRCLGSPESCSAPA